MKKGPRSKGAKLKRSKVNGQRSKLKKGRTSRGPRSKVKRFEVSRSDGSMSTSVFKLKKGRKSSSKPNGSELKRFRGQKRVKLKRSHGWFEVTRSVRGHTVGYKAPSVPSFHMHFISFADFLPPFSHHRACHSPLFPPHFLTAVHVSPPVFSPPCMSFPPVFPPFSHRRACHSPVFSPPCMSFPPFPPIFSPPCMSFPPFSHRRACHSPHFLIACTTNLLISFFRKT